MAVEEARGGLSAPSLPLFIAPMTEPAFRKGALIARALRAHNIGVEGNAPAKMKRLMELANKAGARYALLIGDDELAKGVAQVKDLDSQAQREVPLDGQTYRVPSYDVEAQLIEVDLLPSWFWPHLNGGEIPPAALAEFEALWMELLPLTQKGVDITLPAETKNANQETPDVSQIVLQYSADRRISVNKQDVTLSGGGLQSRVDYSFSDATHGVARAFCFGFHAWSSPECQP